MNRTDRLLAIVLELQARGRRRAEDLAATFETSKRTIYRDIEALCEAGVPVVAVPGQGYSLVAGYFLPPLTFRTDEATMLLLGSEFVGRHVDAEYRAAAESAGRKITAVLPAPLREEVAYLQRHMRFIPLPTGGGGDAEEGYLRKVRQAMLAHQTLRFRYHTRYRTPDAPAPDWRDADPYGLVHMGSAWYMTGFCHVRQAIRHFRLDRVDEMEVLDRRFTRPPGFTFEQGRDEQRPIVVRALFDPQVTRWVQEMRSFFTASEEPTPDGLLVTLRVRQESEVLQWLLGWGAHVRVLEPESLRAQIAEIARAMLHNHAPAESLLT
ncbi:MAG TPA: YafY family protein [Chloroflexia bacterium]|jgi:predicted DNA-binding transcriptional regulator YafY|nr:YafY family protein [Chloroflexia bacterium]